MSKKCKEIRAANTDMKTQLRFGEKDIELLVKERGSDEPFGVVNNGDFMDPIAIPDFDHSKKWIFRGDRPPRRRIDYSSNKKALPSHGHDLSLSPSNRQDPAPLPVARQNSLNELPRKKLRTDESTLMIDVDESI